MSDRYKRIPDTAEPVEMKQMTMSTYRKQFDDKLDDAIDGLKIVDTNARQMGKHIKQGNEMLDKVNEDTEKTTKKMKKANELLESYINSASNCCLYSYIAIALFIFLVLVSI